MRHLRLHHIVMMIAILLVADLRAQSLIRPVELAQRLSYVSRTGGVDTHAPQGASTGPAYEAQKRTVMPRSFSDSTRKESSIKAYSLSDDNNQLKLWLTLTDEQLVEIAVYNILGKKVKDLDRTTFSEGDMKEAVYTVRDIPNGVYIVAAQGSNFRSAIRIVISR
ncbi:MAG: hypothetical protein ACKOAG_02830 [Candidatus Kapaibacterium sp.]